MLGYDDFWIVEIDLPDAVARQLFRIENLDNIGAASYAEMEDLREALILKFQKMNRP